MGFLDDWRKFTRALPERRADAHPFKVLSWLLGRWAKRVRVSGWYDFLRVFEVLAIIVAIAAFWMDMGDRKEERTARMWQLATSKVEGNSGKIPALEFLQNNGHPLTGIKIPRAYLHGVQLPKVNLNNADLSKANLIYSNLSRADLIGANLSGANLLRGNLSGANLSGANLSGADFFRGDLSEANLIGADLSGADLSRADLSRAHLGGGFFKRGSIFFYAPTPDAIDLTGSDLSGPSFTGPTSAGPTLARPTSAGPTSKRL
ncbi:MAG: pentapeptide repeat-containing protein [Rhodospirillales bacterium]|nr:pentapeptide repeat-containing protein [Rhodospirillales bacterium]